jgi:hypothetical protein
MAAPTSPARPPAGGGLVPAEWPAQAADAIVDTIDKVKDKTTKPALTAARAVVYGLLAAVVGPVAIILVLVMLARMYSNWVAGAGHIIPPTIWPLYAVLFVVFMVGGTLMLRKANRPASKA